MFVYVCKQTFQAPGARIAQKLKVAIMRNNRHITFYVKAKILTDFHICISVPLIGKPWSFTKIRFRHSLMLKTDSVIYSFTDIYRKGLIKTDSIADFKNMYQTNDKDIRIMSLTSSMLQFAGTFLATTN